MGVRNLEVKSDSQVVVKHVKGEYEAHGENMKKYLGKVKEILAIRENNLYQSTKRRKFSSRRTHSNCLHNRGRDYNIGPASARVSNAFH
jgi:ribonuclease HI